MKTKTPPGECRQCWHHAHVLHAGNWLGLAKEEDCQPCRDHMNNGCPETMIEPKKESKWW